uniref:Uncharacterized protein n=1 Tax=Caenorhabditis tropicalis TaxID=1561998 RepID=A0A1I7TCT7_9PELO
MGPRHTYLGYMIPKLISFRGRSTPFNEQRESIRPLKFHSLSFDPLYFSLIRTCLFYGIDESLVLSSLEWQR